MPISSQCAHAVHPGVVAIQPPGEEVTNAYAVHPGVVATQLIMDALRNVRHIEVLIGAVSRWMKPTYLKTIVQGAAPQCYVATHPKLCGINGRYFADCKEKESSRYGQDEALAVALRDKTEEISKEFG